MPQFTDSHGNGWSLPITIGTAKRVKERLGVDLVQPLDGDPPLLTRLSTDLIFLCDLLYVCCLPQAEERNISDEAFAECLAGDTLHAAHGALMEGLVDFFHQLHRPEVVAAIERQREVVRRAVELAEATLRSDEFDARIERELQKIPGSLSGDSPDSSASIPSLSPSGS